MSPHFFFTDEVFISYGITIVIKSTATSWLALPSFVRAVHLSTWKARQAVQPSGEHCRAPIPGWCWECFVPCDVVCWQKLGANCNLFASIVWSSLLQKRAGCCPWTFGPHRASAEAFCISQCMCVRLHAAAQQLQASRPFERCAAGATLFACSGG